MVAPVRPKTYNKYDSGVTAVASEALIEDINPSLLNHIAGFQWFSDAAGTTEVAPTAGTVTLEVRNDVTGQWEEVAGSPLSATNVRVKGYYNENINSVRANATGVTGASFFKVIVASNLEDSTEDKGPGSDPVPEDFEGKTPFNTIFGESQVAFKVDDISAQFQYNNSTRDVVIVSNGTGTSSNANSQAVISTGTGVGDSTMTTLDTVRYRPGHESVTMFTTVYTAPEANTKQQMGIFNGNDGLYFGYKGTDYGVHLLQGGTETFYEQSTWNVDPLDGTGASGHILDPLTMNIYKISFGWLGIAPIFFSVYCGKDLGWVLAHVIDLTNFQTTPHLDNPSLPVQIYVERSSGTGSDISVKTSSLRSGILAGQEEDNSSNRWFSFTHTLTGLTGSHPTDEYDHCFTLKNESTFQGKSNHVQGELAIVSFVTDLNKAAEFVGIVNGSLSGNTAFTSVDANNSTNSVSTDGLVTGSTGPATVLAKSDSRRTDVLNTGIILRPGNTFSLGIRTTDNGVATGTVTGSFRWIEKF